MGRKLQAEQHGVFPGSPENRFIERNRVLGRALARRAGLPSPECSPYENLGNRELPVFTKKEQIQKNIRDHQISMVEGATGSGKSTQIAQYALEMGYHKIVYLEPRVLLADNLSDQIERELAGQLGVEPAHSLIGVRHSERSTGYGKPIEIMTPGTYMRVMDELYRYDDEPVLIVGDEIHEKDFETELAVAASVKQLAEHPKWRMVLASATLDAESIHSAYSEMNGRPIPRTMIEGRPHELEVIEKPDLTPAEVYEQYGEGHKKTMIFTAGKAEIKDTISELKKLDGAGKLRITPLHAKLSRRDIRKATHATLREGERQVIVSTSAGQSGITIPELTLVITDGTTRRPELDEDGTPGLFKQECAQDELIQQGGRAGRDVQGGMVVYARPSDELFSYRPFAEREKQAPAQIYHTNISRNVLLASSLGANFYDLNKYLIHKVSQRKILEAYDVLYRLSALDELNEVTELGRIMNKFPVRPELSRALSEGLRQGASGGVMQHLTAVVSAIEAGGLPYFEKGVGSKWRDDIRPETSDDYIAQLDMFYATRPLYKRRDAPADVFVHEAKRGKTSAERYGEELDSYMDEAALEAHNYDPKNTYRAHKTFDKIARSLGMPADGLDLTPPTPDQVRAIHDYLTAGLFDYAHQRVASDGTSRKPTYVSVHDGTYETRRELSDRGTYKGHESLVIGMPRQFEKCEGGELVRHNTIENVFPTSLQKLARHVLHLTERVPVVGSEVVGGHLKRTDELKFGSLQVETTPSVSQLHHTEETKEQLREAAYQKPTQALEELTAIKKQLENLMRITPPDEIADYFPHGIMTDSWLNQSLDQAIDDDVDSIYLLDNKLRTMMVRGDISIRTWLSQDKEQELIERSPELIEIGKDALYQLYYSHGRPIINGFNLKDADELPDAGLFLDDSREVLINYRIGRDTKLHQAGAIKAYATQLSDN